MIPSFVKPDAGTDEISIDAGTGNDAITYEVGTGPDIALIDGGDGNDTLTVKQNGQPVLIQDITGNVIYQFGSGGTTITVANVEHLTVNDYNGNPVFVWP